MAWMLWGMSYNLNVLVYELWPGWFGICAMAWVLWGMSDGLNALGYELWPECFGV